MMLRNLFIAAALCVTTEGFAPPSASTRPSSTSLSLMSAAEIESIIKEAESCAEGECALDEVESLINNLQDQQSALSKRVSEINDLVTTLETANGKDDRPVDEVRETVRAIFRVFALGDKASGNDYPSLSKPMGYSGDTAGGGKTAYDVLPPKPITK